MSVPRIEESGVEALSEFIDVIEEAGQWLWDRDIRQWEPGSHRAQRDGLARWVERGTLLQARSDEGLDGGCIVSREPLPFWPGDTGGAAYLYKLAVARRAAGRGVGDALLERALAWTAASGLGVLRLDCWAGSAPLRRFYGANGFSECGVTAEGPFWVRLFARSTGPIGDLACPSG